jgi:cytochrome b6-f complex iron-sulfur subunit
MEKIVGQRSTRREFCAQACGAAGLVALGSALQACGGTPGSATPSIPVLTGSPGNGVVTLAIDASSPLAAVGSGALVRSATGTFLVSRTAADSFSALDSTCTHETCTITGFDRQEFVCPCHGSRFDPSGRVVMGPASRALRSFRTSFASDILTIAL